jgi:hypothetical protein
MNEITKWARLNKEQGFGESQPHAGIVLMYLYAGRQANTARGTKSPSPPFA